MSADARRPESRNPTHADSAAALIQIASRVVLRSGQAAAFAASGDRDGFKTVLGDLEAIAEELDDGIAALRDTLDTFTEAGT